MIINEQNPQRLQLAHFKGFDEQVELLSHAHPMYRARSLSGPA